MSLSRAAEGAPRRLLALGRQWRRRLGVAALLGVLAAGLSYAPGADFLTRLGTDFLFPLRHWVYGPLFAPAESDVVVVAVDEQSYRTPPLLNTPKVAWTPVLAVILNAVNAADPKVVGVDTIYPTTLDREGLVLRYDLPMKQALRRAADKGKIVLGKAIFGGEELKPYDGLVTAARGDANLRLLNLDLDQDDVVRGYFLKHADEAQGATTSFGAELALRAGAVLPDKNFLINFNTAPGDIPVYSMVDLLQCAEVAKDEAYFRRHFAGKIVLFGEALDLEDRFISSRRLVMNAREDQRAAPERCVVPKGPERASANLDRRSMPGVLIHAAAINTITKGLYLTPLSPQAATFAIFGSVFLLSLMFFLVSPVQGLLLGGVALLGELALSVHAFAAGAVAPVVLLAGTALLTYTLIYAYRFVVEDKERRWIQHAFRHYLAPVLVERLAADPKALRLGGEKKRVTLFFSDIAGFTTISENLKDRPELLVEILNRYLTVMTAAVEARGGYVDKFIGDAVMAVWGAPLPDDQAERHGVEAALDCFAALERFNTDIVQGEYGMKPIGTRIGLNTGVAIVGNMGSASRLNYTVTGDTVNLAARLEGANKEYGSRIMVSDETVTGMGQGFVLRRLDRLVVKGKSEPIKVYEVVGREGEVDAAALERVIRFHAALDLYDAREFSAAATAFDALATQDPAAEMYAERCRHYLDDPPPLDWNGAFEMKTK